jgi:hypothetical protein
MTGRLAHARALRELGRGAEARAAIADAVRAVEELAARIVSPELRRSYREEVPDVAAILTLALPTAAS